MENALRAIANKHYQETKHKIMLGLNFVHCFKCGYHVHACNKKIIEHNRDYTLHRVIDRF